MYQDGKSPNRRQVPPPINTQPGPTSMRQGRFLSPTTAGGGGGGGRGGAAGTGTAAPIPPASARGLGGYYHHPSQHPQQNQQQQYGGYGQHQQHRHQHQYGYGPGASATPSHPHRYQTYQQFQRHPAPHSNPAYQQYPPQQQLQQPAPPTTNTTSPTQVRFRELQDNSNAHGPGGEGTGPGWGDAPPAFLFEECELSDGRSNDGGDNNDAGAVKDELRNQGDMAAGNFRGDPSAVGDNASAGASLLPSEAQLTLLCLDYLRDLRRSYHDRQDMLNAEGLNADYVALAVWSLSRAFVKPAKLRHSNARVSTVVERRGVETNYLGGGGLAGLGGEKASGGQQSVLDDDVPSGNDAWYRQLDDDVVCADEDRRGDNTGRNNIFALSDTISIPTMEDITEEVLLLHPNEEPFPRKLAGRDDSDEDDDDGEGGGEDDEEDMEEEPFYEHNDNHISNSHRFYLLNGLAADASSSLVEGLATPRGAGGAPQGFNNDHAYGPTSPRAAPYANASASSAGPLSLSEVVTAGLTTLRARTRIDADREMVCDNPLFGQFVQAASAGGFFNERSSPRRKSAGGADADVAPALTAEEEERRSRMLYEEKYRKIVSKFRSKLASKEAEKLHGLGGGGGGGGHHHHRDSRIRNAYGIMSSGASVGSSVGGGGGGQDNPSGYASNPVAVCNDIADAQRRRRERRIARVRGMRVEDFAMPRNDGANAAAVSSPPVSPRARVNNVDEDDNAEMRERMAPILQTTPPRKKRQEQQPAQDATTPQRRNAPPPPSPVANLPHYQEAERLNALGNDQISSKAFRDALGSYTAAIQKAPAGPNSHVYYSNRSAAHLSLNNHRESIEDSEKSLALKPNYAKGHSRLGLAHFAMGDYEAAIKCYERSLEIDGDNEWSRIHLEKAREELSKSKGGATEALEDAPKSATVEEEGGNDDGEVQIKKGGDGAEVVDEAGVEEDNDGKGAEPDDDDSWLSPFEETGDASLTKEDPPSKEEEESQVSKDDKKSEEKITVAEEAKRVAEEQANEAERLAEEEAKRLEQERIEARQLEEKVRIADGHKDRGNEYMSKKKYDEALLQYNSAISTSPSGPNSHVYYSNRAAAYCYLAEYKSASNDCRSSIALNPSYEKAHARLGLSLFFQGDYKAAIGAYEESLKLDPNNRASMSYLKKTKARYREQLEREEKEAEEKANQSERRREAVEQRRQQYQQKVVQQQQPSNPQSRALATIEDEHEEEGEEQSLGGQTGLTSIVTNDNGGGDEEEIEVSVSNNDDGGGRGVDIKHSGSFSPVQAFDPFDNTDGE